MGINYCTVPKCKGGGPLARSLGVTMHRLPSDKKLLSKWIKNIPKDEEKIAKTAKICSIHFTPDCFAKISRDTNHRRRPKNTQLKRIQLLPYSVPTLFYDHDTMSFEECVEKSANSLSEQKGPIENKVEDEEEGASEDFTVDACRLNHLEELYIRLSEELYNSDLWLIRKDKGVICMSTSLIHNGHLAVDFSLTILCNLSFIIFGRDGEQVPDKCIRHLCPNLKVSSVETALKLINYLKARFED